MRGATEAMTRPAFPTAALFALMAVLAVPACSSLRDGSEDDAGVSPDASGTGTTPPSGRDGGPVDDDGGPGPGDSSTSDGATRDASDPGPTAGLKVDSLTVGENVACVVFEGGLLRCWGDYRLAGGGSTSTPKPSPIPYRASPEGGGYIVGVAEVKASYRHACARLLSGKFACWGFNNEYQLGDFTRDIGQSTSITPFARLVRDSSVSGPALMGSVNLTGLGRVAAGYMHSAAILADGSVVTWGNGNVGTLGRGSPDQASAIAPKPVIAAYVQGQSPPADDRLLGVIRVELGSKHGCATLTGGAAACWGDNSGGKLGKGDGVTVSDGRPRTVVTGDGTGLAKVAVGESSACALTNMGRVRCWGDNNWGQLGITGSSSSASVDVLTAGASPKPLDRVIDVGVGSGFACALTEAAAGGKVYCWGNGTGSQLGDGSAAMRASAGPVASALAPVKTDLTGVRLLAVGDRGACAVIGDRDVRCWGKGPIGERGVSSSESTIPRPVDDL